MLNKDVDLAYSLYSNVQKTQCGMTKDWIKAAFKIMTKDELDKLQSDDFIDMHGAEDQIGSAYYSNSVKKYAYKSKINDKLRFMVFEDGEWRITDF
jgi:hypothetical protein